MHITSLVTPSKLVAISPSKSTIPIFNSYGHFQSDRLCRDLADYARIFYYFLSSYRKVNPTLTVNLEVGSIMLHKPYHPVHFLLHSHQLSIS